MISLEGSRQEDADNHTVHWELYSRFFANRHYTAVKTWGLTHWTGPRIQGGNLVGWTNL